MWTCVEVNWVVMCGQDVHRDECERMEEERGYLQVTTHNKDRRHALFDRGVFV